MNYEAKLLSALHSAKVPWGDVATLTGKDYHEALRLALVALEDVFTIRLKRQPKKAR